MRRPHPNGRRAGAGQPVHVQGSRLALRVRWARVTDQLAHEETRSARGFRGERAEFADPDEDLRAAISMFAASLAHGGRARTRGAQLGISWKSAPTARATRGSGPGD